MKSLKIPSLQTGRTRVHRLRKNQFISLRRPNGLCLRAERGSLWVTVDGNPNDIELDAGKSRVFEGRETVVVGSLGGDAVFCATHPATPWVERLRHWLTQPLQQAHAQA